MIHSSTSAFARVIASLVAIVAIVGATLLANVSTDAIAGGNPPPPPGKIVVKVTDDAGKPVGGAIVELFHKDHMLRREMTGRDGMTGFRFVVPAQYGVRAGKRGVGVAKEVITVESGKTTAVRLALKKPSTTGNSVGGGSGGAANSGESASVVTAK